jgi:hypothetical protein
LLILIEKYPVVLIEKYPVSDIQIITIGNISDSLKIITLKTIPSSNYFNDKTITISKNNGICRLYNLYEFPSVSYYDEYDINSIKSIDFVRIFPENSKQKLKNITSNDIFNFEIGDEFHTENINKLLGPQMQYQVFEKKKVIKKIAIADSIIYVFAVNGTRTEWIGNINPKTFQYKDTITNTYKNENWMNLLPGQVFYSKINGIPVLYEIVNLSLSNLYNNKIIKTTFKYGIQQKSENCYSLQSFTPGFSHIYYVEGCGGPFYEGVYDNIWGDHFKLVYFKKGSETWGSPLAVNNEILIKPKFNIYPIPAKETIIFKLNEYSNQKYHFFLFNNIGQIIINVPFTNNKLEIKRNGLPNGMYTYRIISTKGEVIIGKVMFN